MRDNLVSQYSAKESLFKDQRDEAELKAKRIEKEYSVLQVIFPY